MYVHVGILVCNINRSGIIMNVASKLLSISLIGNSCLAIYSVMHS